MFGNLFPALGFIQPPEVHICIFISIFLISLLWAGCSVLSAKLLLKSSFQQGVTLHLNANRTILPISTWLIALDAVLLPAFLKIFVYICLALLPSPLLLPTTLTQSRSLPPSSLLILLISHRDAPQRSLVELVDLNKCLWLEQGTILWFGLLTWEFCAADTPLYPCVFKWVFVKTFLLSPSVILFCLQYLFLMAEETVGKLNLSLSLGKSVEVFCFFYSAVYLDVDLMGRSCIILHIL